MEYMSITKLFIYAYTEASEYKHRDADFIGTRPGNYNTLI